MLIRSALVCAIVLTSWPLFGSSQALAQPGVLPPPAAAQPPASQARGAFRKLVPGVETTIPADCQPEETWARHSIVEIVKGSPNLAWTPNTLAKSATLAEQANQAVIRRPIWCLEFSFKPLRMIWVDLPQADGRTQRKLVWYLVYRVKNTGRHMNPVEQSDGTSKIELVDHAVLNDKVGIMPIFLLESHEYKAAYLDRIIPQAVAAIQQREDPNRKLLNSVEINSVPVQVSTPSEDKSVWGVATWEDVDPRMDFFSIYVEGLTNAYRWEDPPGKYKAGDPPGTGRTFTRKNLKLNFWRPGDEYFQHEQEIRFGMPDVPGVLEKYKSDAKVDYQWVYR